MGTYEKGGGDFYGMTKIHFLKIVKTLPGPTSSMIVKGGEPFCTETDTQKDKRHSVTFVEFCKIEYYRYINDITSKLLCIHKYNYNRKDR